MAVARKHSWQSTLSRQTALTEQFLHIQEDTKRQGSATRVQTQALFSEIQSQAAPSDQVLPEEFAESARGIAGMDCFELYGGSKKAPALASTAEGSGEKEPEEQAAADDANAYALATCLNTPYTGEVNFNQSSFVEDIFICLADS